ncbi:MAG: hypothetical protein IID43_01245 [Planctomycetes bacterium]|nr:hypothetical protein [Planctomycetota bacterium]
MGRKAFTTKQLDWIVGNRRKFRHSTPVGSWAMRVLERARPRTSPATVHAAVTDVVDQEFLDHCTIGPLQGGVLTILVDDARLVYAFRWRWVLHLIEHLQAKHPGIGVQKVCFTTGAPMGQRR